MTLANRLSVFFLVVLGIVLAALCVGVSLATHWYLTTQTDQGLMAGLNTIVAAIEIVPEGVEWEPAERNLVLEQGPLGQQIFWVLVDSRGRQVDGSLGDAGRERLMSAAADYPLASKSAEPRVVSQPGWKLAQQWLTPARLHPELEYQPDAEHKFMALGVTAAIATRPIDSLVRGLAIGLVATSAVLWLVAWVVGGRIGRHMLSPIRRLAQVASRVDASRLAERVAPPKTGDELETLALAFNGLLDRLQESFERQRRFTGDAAHQLRTPLTAMQGELEVALRRERSPDEYQAALDKLLRNVLHLHDMVESLLFLARADDDARLREFERIELAAWLIEHLAQWRREHRQTELLARVTELDCRVRAQSVLLGELVGIVLDNADKYREPGTPIWVELDRHDGTASLMVENLSPPIQANELAQIFEPFYRGEHARRRGVDGLGLGLAIARRLSETFGGRLGVTYENGRMRFTIELPLAAADETLANQGSSGAAEIS